MPETLTSDLSLTDTKVLNNVSLRSVLSSIYLPSATPLPNSELQELVKAEAFVNDVQQIIWIK